MAEYIRVRLRFQGGWVASLLLGLLFSMPDIPAYKTYSSHSHAISTLTPYKNTCRNSLALNLNLERVGIDYDYLHMFTISHTKHHTNKHKHKHHKQTYAETNTKKTD
jgi:hypothetical protein